LLLFRSNPKLQKASKSLKGSKCEREGGREGERASERVSERERERKKEIKGGREGIKHT